jgi:hypothetical protein
MAQLVQQLSEQLRQPVLCRENLTGSLTSRFSATNGLEALCRILDPLGFTAEINSDGIVRISKAKVRPATSRAASSSVAPVAKSTSHKNSIPPANPKPATEIALVSFVTPGSTSDSKSTTAPASQRKRKSRDVIRRENDSPVATAVTECELRARELLNSGNEDAAVDLLAQSVADEPNQARALQLLAQAYLGKGDLEAAQTAIERSLAIDRRNADANETMARILLGRGQENRGRHYLQQAQFLRSLKR